LKVELVQGKGFLDVNTYMSTYKQSAVLYTVASHIRNMIKGVTKGFRYKMHIVKKHFPLEVKIDANTVEIGRFLGERDLKVIKLLEGVTCSKNEKNQEELYFDGNDIEKVSLTCSHVYQSCAVHGKDKRKFLDGIYVNEKTTIEK
jgi:large subunit ribosomal protein L9e